jgi:hypothetical protein
MSHEAEMNQAEFLRIGRCFRFHLHFPFRDFPFADNFWISLLRLEPVIPNNPSLPNLHLAMTQSAIKEIILCRAASP